MAGTPRAAPAAAASKQRGQLTTASTAVLAQITSLDAAPAEFVRE
jgi:hypothetical protein